MSEAVTAGEIAPVQDYTNVLVNPPNTTLCDLAEPKLKDALLDGGFIMVNGLLVKPNGLVAAVPPEPIEAEGGTMRPGYFYRMYHYRGVRWDDPEGASYKEDQIKQAFIAGETEIMIPGRTDWFEVRPVRIIPEKLTQLVGEAVTKLMTEGRPKLPDARARKGFIQAGSDLEFLEA